MGVFSSAAGRRAAGRVMLLAATASAALMAPAYAQAQQPAAAEASPARQVRFDIPAQPLTDALALFGRQSGLQVSADAALLRGKASPGVAGAMAPETALDALLAGTGLTFHMQDGNAVMLEALPESGGAIHLSPIRVEGSRFGAATEHSGSYTSNRVTIGRGERSLREIPQTVEVITRERMNDQGALTIDEALGQTAGVTVSRYNNKAHIYSMRGFQVSSLLLDGSPVNADVGYTDTGSFDTALFDRIEVMRGPTGLLQGTGEPSGSINLVRKRAEAEFGASAGLTVGSWDTRRVETDITGALDEEERLRARFVGVYDDRESYIDYVESEKFVGYLTLEYDITPDTTVAIGTVQQNGDSVPSLGLPNGANGELLDLDRSTYLGSTWDHQDENLQRYFAELEHVFPNGASFNLKANAVKRKTDIKQSSAGNTFPDAANMIEMFPWRSIHRMEDRSLDAYVTMPFEMFGREHEIQTGASHFIHKTQLTWGASASGTFMQDIYNPNPNRPEPVFNTNMLPETTSKETGVYMQGRFAVLDDTTLVLGGRLNWWQTRTEGNPSGDVDIDNEFTPYAGLIYDVSDELSVYTSYATIFEPQTDQDINFQPLDPRTGDQVELGIKGEHLNGKLNWYAAIFEINDKDRAVDQTGVTPGPGQNPWPMVNAGEARSRGLEVSATGEFLPLWDLSAGYTYIDTEFLNGLQGGMRLSPATPEHDVKIWTRYRFSDEPSGWQVAGGLNYVSGVYAQDGATRWEQGAYTLLSAQVGYRFNEHAELLLKANNLTDEKYYSNVSGWSRQSYYGEPRNAMLTLRYTY